MEQTTCERDLMLSVAREAIESRAYRDGHTDGQYDAESDPEGYVTSLLNALHRWCAIHGIDWQKELVRAQSFFEEDGGEPDIIRVPPSPKFTDLRCPKCGQQEGFIIEIRHNVLMFDDDIALHGNTEKEWGDDSLCRCFTCKHLGLVFQFHSTDNTQQEVAHG